MARVPKTMRAGEVRICLGVSTGGSDPEDRFATLTVEDEASGVIILEAELNTRHFAHLLSSRYITDVPAVFGAFHLVGCRSEHKEELVAMSSKHRYGVKEGARRLLARKLLRKHEVNGWIGTEGDLWNGHRNEGPDHQRVSFVRYMDDKTGKPVKP